MMNRRSLWCGLLLFVLFMMVCALGAATETTRDYSMWFELGAALLLIACSICLMYWGGVNNRIFTFFPQNPPPVAGGFGFRERSFLGTVLAAERAELGLADQVIARQTEELIWLDFGPHSVDALNHEGRIRIADYRGILHWFRDALEKCASLILVFAFALFVARVNRLFLEMFFRNSCDIRKCIEHQLWTCGSMAIDLVAIVLITDGVIQAASMLESPGIKRAIDALAITLAGLVIMAIDIQPGMKVSFGIGNGTCTESNTVYAIALVIVVCVLYITRWFIWHSTFRDMQGR